MIDILSHSTIRGEREDTGTINICHDTCYNIGLHSLNVFKITSPDLLRYTSITTTNQKKTTENKTEKVCGHKSDHLQTLGATSGALFESLEILLLGGSQHCCQDSVILPLTQTCTRGREREREGSKIGGKIRNDD